MLLVKLWDALKRCGGLEEEGIFRLAPDASKSDALREALNTDGEALARLSAEDDAHVLANLIKIWSPHPPALSHTAPIALASLALASARLTVACTCFTGCVWCVQVPYAADQAARFRYTRADCHV